MNTNNRALATLLAFAMSLSSMLAFAGACSNSSERIELHNTGDSCARFESGDRGWWIFKEFWYSTDNQCLFPVEFKVVMDSSWDSQFVLGPNVSKTQDPAHARPVAGYCCQDNPDTACTSTQAIAKGLIPDGDAPPPPYFFRVGFSDAMQSMSVEGSSPWTARLECHSHDLGRWIDEAIAPQETVWCDAYYGANVHVTFNTLGGGYRKVRIDPPPANPCGERGGPAYEITLSDEGALSTDVKHKRIGCH